MRISTIILYLSMVFTAHAQEVFPKECIPLLIDGELIAIPAADSRIIMIHNLSTVDLWITHPISKPGASAGWSSRLQSGNWSALSMNHAQFELSCIESRPGHEQQISCKHVVGVCEWPTSARPKKPTGIFWAAENMALSPLIAYIGRHGFMVPPHQIK
jgi:hypothetical protein